MVRARRYARCSHSGPRCHKCIRSTLMNRMLMVPRVRAGSVSPAERQHMLAVIDVQVSASVLANDNNERSFGTRILAVLPEIHAEAERAYTRALSMVSDIDAESAKAAALNIVASRLDGIFRHYDRLEELSRIPSNAQRAERLRRRSELRNASYHVQFFGGISGANDHVQLQALLARMSEGIRSAILQQCTNPAREGETLHLVVTITEAVPPRQSGYTYRLFSRNGAGVGYGAGANEEMTYLSGMGSGLI